MEARPALLKKILGELIVLLGKWLVFIAALLALGAGFWLLLIVSHGSPVAAAFTRVGGVTRVETAVDASHFWVTPPRYFVTTPAYANQQTMLWAAQIAMAHDAPLLFTSRNQNGKRLVRRTINNWRFDASTKRPKLGYHPTWINVVKPPGRKLCPVYKSPAAKRLAAINRTDRIILQHDLTAELHGGVLDRLIGGVPPNLPGLVIAKGPLSTLTASNHLLPCPLPVAHTDTLAPVVVFAVARRPVYPPDVAVGLALAAHLATASPEVSLVVVPRNYLEADPQLENELRNQRALVQGGVVLGSTRILTDDTQTLLRQILTSTDQRGVLGEIRTNLGLVAPLIAALLALLGLETAAIVAPEIRKRVVKYGEEIKKREPKEKEKDVSSSATTSSTGGPVKTVEQTSSVKDGWLSALDEAQSGGRDEITVWLRNGRRVTGKVDSQHCTATVLRLKGATQLKPEPGYTAAFLLVLFEEIESIGTNVQTPTS
jgi:hypothetical protein